MPDDELPKIGAPAARALASIGVTRLSQLAGHTERELLALHGFGPKALRILREALADEGLDYRERESVIPMWPASEETSRTPDCSSR